MVIEHRIVMMRHHPPATQRLYDAVSQTPRFGSSYPDRHGQARLAPSRPLRQHDAECSGRPPRQPLAVSAPVGGSAPPRNTLSRAHIPRPRPAVAIGAGAGGGTRARRGLDAASLREAQAPRGPAERRGGSPRLPPSLGPRRPCHPLEATADRGGVSPRCGLCQPTPQRGHAGGAQDGPPPQRAGCRACGRALASAGGSPRRSPLAPSRHGLGAGGGRTAGSRAAGPEGGWGCAPVHACQALVPRGHPRPRQAWGALGKASAAAATGAHAPSAAHLPKRLQPSAPARHAGEQALARSAHLALWLHRLRAPCPVGSAAGRRRTVAAVRAEVRVLLRLRHAREEEHLPPRLPSLRAPRDARGVPWRPVASLPAARLAGLPHPRSAACGLAWPQDPLAAHAPGPHTPAHRRACAAWLALAAALRDAHGDGLTVRGCAQRDAMGQAASLVAMGPALLRPSRTSAHGPIPHATCPLLLVSPTPRRDQGAQRQGTAPMARVTAAV